MSIWEQTKIIIFDHDDTLVGTISSKWAQHKYIAQKYYGKILFDDEIKQHWGKPFSVLLKLLYETNDVEKAMTYNKKTRQKFPKILLEDTLPLLKTLRQNERKIGLVTATTRSSLFHDLDMLGIPKTLFDYLQTEDDTIFHKPDSRVFIETKKWLIKQDIKPSEVIYIGDSLNDMKAAQGGGFNFIGVCTGLVSFEEFEQHRVKAIKSLKDLLLITKS